MALRLVYVKNWYVSEFLEPINDVRQGITVLSLDTRVNTDWLNENNEQENTTT